MTKHEYADTGVRPYLDLASHVILYMCNHCKKTIMLEKWQLKKMPKTMAKCSKGINSSFIEWLTGSYNCLGGE